MHVTKKYASHIYIYIYEVYIRFKTENGFHDDVISLSQRNKSLSYYLAHKWKVS